MMKLLGILALYQVVSARLVFVDRSSQQDDMYSNLFNDINLDISFEKEPPMHMDMMNDNSRMNMHMNMMNNLKNMNHMNSMFSFPAFPSVSSFFDTPRDGDSMSVQQPSSKPLYLLVESLSNPSNQRKSNMFALEKSSKVNGNTWRYTLKSDGQNPAIITESWSSPTMYLCNSKCGSTDGMQMMDIVNHFKDSFGQQYMHLVPSTTERREEEQPMMMMMGSEEEEEAPMMMGHMGRMMGHMGTMGGNVASGCRNRMQRIKDWYYGDEVTEMDEGNDMQGEIVILDTDEERQEEEFETELMMQQHEARVLMALLLGFGMCYILWRCCACKSERKEETRGETGHYVAMGENDKF
eukprot:567682_1